MPFVINKETGVIHTDCKAGLGLDQKRKMIVETLQEARIIACKNNLTPRLCKRCKSVRLREVLQKELNY